MHLLRILTLTDRRENEEEPGDAKGVCAGCSFNAVRRRPINIIWDELLSRLTRFLPVSPPRASSLDFTSVLPDLSFLVGCQWGRWKGLGVAEYANQDRVIGDFVGTHLQGYGVFVFGASGTAR